MSIGRRRFLQNTGAASLLPLAGTVVAQSTPEQPTNARVQKYHRLGRTELEIADISFGSSRLRLGEEHLVELALERGINYFDTAESYGKGDSETVLGNALKGRRDQVILASKQFCGATTSTAAMMHELEASLRRLQTDYIDVYFNHAVNDVERQQNPAWAEFINKARTQGKIRFTGISGHAGHLIENLDFALDNNLIDVMLVAHNFGQDPAFYERMTRSFDFVAKQPDLPRVLAKAKAKDIGVIAMKTLMGARLNDMRPYEQEGASYAQAAFRWTLANPDVDALIVSMTSTEQIHEYLAASGSAPKDQAAMNNADVELLRHYAAVSGATYCRHACNDCSGACPFGVPIADVLRTRMYATDYQDVPFARAEYAQLAGDASPCLSCSGEPCASACSHGLNIADLCAPTHRMLA